MTDIVERLRRSTNAPDYLRARDAEREAAAEIERLRAENRNRIDDLVLDNDRLLDQIERLRVEIGELNLVLNSTDYKLDKAMTEIERLRHPKIIVGSRKVWEAMGEIISEAEDDQQSKGTTDSIP